MEKKLTSFNVRIPAELKAKFDKTLMFGMSIQHITTAMVRLWVSLPDDLRVSLIFRESTGQVNGSGIPSFDVAVRSILSQVAKETKEQSPRQTPRKG